MRYIPLEVRQAHAERMRAEIAAMDVLATSLAPKRGNGALGWALVGISLGAALIAFMSVVTG